MRRLRVRKLARAEIAEAFDWYLQHSSTTAPRFLEAVEHAIGLIENAPEQSPIVHGRLRRVLLRGFPYALYYKVFPSVVSVVGVIHGHRHPRTWLQR